jgi:L-gulonate 3-dehydrogenase
MNQSKIDMSKPVAVVGAGLVGAGWAIAFARAGLSVRVYDANPRVASDAIPWAAEQLAALHRHGLIAEPPEDVKARLVVAHSLEEAIEGAAYVQESVLERVEIKRKLMTDIDAIADANVIIGSSSSGIQASMFANDLNISPRVLIAHPVNPPYLVPVVELVPSTQTSQETIQFANTFMQAIGQSVVHVRKEIEGFVLNRLQAALLREAWALQRDGIASCEDIDKTVRDGLGWRWSFMGPFETIDLNAPGGAADYIARYEGLYQNLWKSQQYIASWAEASERVDAERRAALPKERLAEHAGWRDRRLMALLAHKREAAKKIV